MSKSSERSKVQTVSRRDIIRTVAVRADVSLDKSKEVVDLLLNEIIDELAKGNRIEFRGFGVFKPMIRKGAKMRYNPRTREPMGPGKDQKFAKFKVGKKLKEAMNNELPSNTH